VWIKRRSLPSTAPCLAAAISGRAGAWERMGVTHSLMADGNFCGCCVTREDPCEIVVHRANDAGVARYHNNKDSPIQEFSGKAEELVLAGIEAASGSGEARLAALARLTALADRLRHEEELCLKAECAEVAREPHDGRAAIAGVPDFHGGELLKARLAPSSAAAVGTRLAEVSHEQTNVLIHTGSGLHECEGLEERKREEDEKQEQEKEKQDKEDAKSQSECAEETVSLPIISQAADLPGVPVHPEGEHPNQSKRVYERASQTELIPMLQSSAQTDRSVMRHSDAQTEAAGQEMLETTFQTAMVGLQFEQKAEQLSPKAEDGAELVRSSMEEDAAHIFSQPGEGEEQSPPSPRPVGDWEDLADFDELGDGEDTLRLEQETRRQLAHDAVVGLIEELRDAALDPHIQELHMINGLPALWSSIRKGVNTWPGLHITPLFIYLYLESPEVEKALTELDANFGTPAGAHAEMVRGLGDHCVGALKSCPEEYTLRERISHLKTGFYENGATRDQEIAGTEAYLAAVKSHLANEGANITPKPENDVGIQASDEGANVTSKPDNEVGVQSTRIKSLGGA